MEYLKNNKVYIVDLFLILFTVLFTLHIENKFDGFEWMKNNYLFVLIVITLLVFSLMIFKLSLERKEKKLAKINRQITEENEYLQSLISAFKYQISKPIEDLLHEASKTLGFNEKHRITLYTYTSGCFFSIARYSSNPKYNEFGRIAIKNPEEFIFQVWNGAEKCKTLKIAKDRKMPTQKICVHFLYEKNHDHPQKDKIGLVVFESIENKNKHFNNGKFSEQVDIINEFVQSNLDIKPDLSLAIKEGL